MGEEVRGASQAGNSLPSTTHVRIETEEERIERVAREEEERIEREAFEALDQLFEGAVPEGETEAERIARENREEEEMDRLARAMRQTSKNVVYKDYQMKQDFTLWLQGFREKIRSQYGYESDRNGENEVNAEVIRLISGRLEPGTPLDTYNRLSATVRANYDQLVEALTAAFTDPQAKRNFLKDFGYDKRKKGQTIHEFMQVIMNNQNRFGGMPDKIEVGGASVPNEAKVKDGIRRFTTGMRDKRGKKNKSLMEVLDFNLMEDADFTWENAIGTVVRWENSHPMDTDSDSSSSSSSSEEEPEEEDKKKKKKKGKGKQKPVEATLDMAAVKTEMTTGIATLSDKVEANTRDIRGIKSQQERTEVNMAAWKSETSSTLNQLLQGQQQMQQQLRYRPPMQPQQNRAPFQRFPRFPQARPQLQQFPARPQTGNWNPNWKTRFGQTQQTGFGFNNRTPSQFPRYPTAPPAGPANSTAPAPAAPAAPAAGTAATIGAAADDDGMSQQLQSQQVAHQLFEQHQQEQSQYEQQQFDQQQYDQQYLQQTQGEPQGAMVATMGQYFDDGSQGYQEGYEYDVLGALNRWNFG